MQFYQSTLLNKFSNIKHAFTSRNSGNLAFHVNDNELHVRENHRALAIELGYDMDSLVHMKQIHSDIVHVVQDENFENPPTCDALITDKTDTPLMVMVADCSPILFYDDKKGVIAVAHAGRQGAFKNIVQNVVESFRDIFNSNLEDIHVSVGANIGSCCYEVGEEIYDEAKELGLEYALKINNSSYYLDISNIIETQLLACGIKKEKIEISEECSCCENEKYFSYRAEPSTGRFAGLIMLNS